MNTARLVTVAALSLIAAAAQAETYEGVHPVTSGLSRAEVSVQGPAAVRAGNEWGENASGGVAPLTAASTDRTRVQAGAVAAAHNPVQNLNASAFVNSQIPTEYTNGSLASLRKSSAL